MAVLGLSATASPVLAAGGEFPPLRHAIKAVFGKDGNDHGGDLQGYGKGLVKAFHDLKIDLTRIEFKWALIEPTRGTYDWREADRLINFLHENGVEPMLMMYCAPKWAMRGTPADEELFIARNETNLHTVVWPKREFLPDFERFCETAARRYAGKARLYEWWNEPDGMAGPIVLHDKSGKAVDVRYGGDAKEYTYWLQRMYAAVKRGNPDAVIAAGSLCVHTTKFIEGMYASGCAEFCDAISLHPYADEGINVDWIRQCRAVMDQNGDWGKPIWLSEFGWQAKGEYDAANNRWPESVGAQAEQIGKAFQQMLSVPSITQAYWFTLNDWNTSESGIDPAGTHHWGVCDMKLNRRPSFEALRRVVAESPGAPRPVEFPPVAVRPAQRPIDLLGPVMELASAGILLGHPPRPGTYPVTLGLGQSQSVEFPVTIPARASRVDQSPKVDGDLAEWSDRLDIVDGKMRAGFAWDERYLYFACRMSDVGHEQPHEGGNMWKGDCVQLAFDPLRDAVRGSKYDDNDTELTMALTARGPALWRHACPLDSYVGALPAEWVSIRREGRTTCYELKLPWAEIAVDKPGIDKIIGATIAGCEYQNQQRTLHLFGSGVIGSKEPYRYGSIRLAAEQ